jgi:hypothetical protein
MTTFVACKSSGEFHVPSANIAIFFIVIVSWSEIRPVPLMAGCGKKQASLNIA